MTNKIAQLINKPIFVKKMVKADTTEIKNGQVTLNEMKKEFSTLGLKTIETIFAQLWVKAGSQKTAQGEKYISLKWLQTQNISQQIAALQQQKNVLIAKEKSISRGGILTACANVDPGVVNNNNKLTQTDFFVQVNTTGGAKWNVNPAAHPSSANPPVLNIPNKYLPHVKDANVLVRVWRLDANGNRMAGEVHTMAIDAATKRIVDPTDTTGSISANYANSVNSNADPNLGTYYKINYSEFTTAGPVYGVQFEVYYSTGPDNHPIAMSAYSPAIMNPSAPIDRNANLDAAPLLLIEKPATGTGINYYLGVKGNFQLPDPNAELQISFGSETINAVASSIFDYSSVATDDSYQYNGSAIKKIKFKALSDFLNTYGGTASLKLEGYANKVTIKSEQLSTSTTAFSAGSVSNINSASANLNWNGVDNSALWTVQVQTDASGNQYNEYTIPAATWNTLSTNYGIPVAQLRLLIVRGDGTNDPSTLATTYSQASGYNPGSPYATVAQFEAAGFDVPVVRTTGADYATPTTGSPTGEGAEIGPAGGTGPTVVRFKTSSSSINTIRQSNDGSIKVLVFQAGVANNGTNVNIHSLNLSISSGETAQFDRAITEKEN